MDVCGHAHWVEPKPQAPPTMCQLGVFQLAGIDDARLGGAWLKLRPLLCSQPWGCVV